MKVSCGEGIPGVSWEYGQSSEGWNSICLSERAFARSCYFTEYLGPYSLILNSLHGRYRQVLYVGDLYHIPDTITIRETAMGKVVALTTQSRPSTPNSSGLNSPAGYQSPAPFVMQRYVEHAHMNPTFLAVEFSTGICVQHVNIFYAYIICYYRG